MELQKPFLKELLFQEESFKLYNEYRLVRIGDTEIYEIRTKNNVTFKIDKDFLNKLFIHKTQTNIISILTWECTQHSKTKICSMINGNKINIINYLTDNTSIDIKYLFKNNDCLDFRLSNIEITKTHTKKLAAKNKKIETPIAFYKENEIRILEEGQGIKLTNGQYARQISNNYRLVEIINELDSKKKQYYEIFVGCNVKTITTPDDKPLLQYSFIIDFDDFEKIRNVSIINKNNEKQIIHPIWHMSAGQYIVSNIQGQKIYLHRYLMNVEDTNNTIDHINNNKFDNRKANLRITTQSIQNMNQTNKDHKISLNSIINPTNDPTLPKLTNDKLIFIHPEKHTNSDGNIYIFRIEISESRTKHKYINDHSTKQNKDGLTVIHRLAHAIVKRYLYSIQYPNIISEMLDNKRFTNLNEFKIYSETLLFELLKTTTTIDAFLDYMEQLKLPKYIDPRTNIQNYNKSNNISNANISNVSLTSSNDITKMKFDFLNYNTKRDKYEVCVIIGKDTNGKHIKYTKFGCGCDNLSLEDKKAFSLVLRYNIFVEIENDSHTQTHHSETSSATTSNTTKLKSLSDFKLEGQTFSSIANLRTYTESLINQLVLSITNTDQLYTLESFASYVTKKANHKKINLAITKQSS